MQDNSDLDHSSKLTRPIEVAQRLRRQLRDIPHRPGVYLMRDRFRHIIYVGKAKDLRRRLANYFSPSSFKRADVKTRALIQSIHHFEYHLVKSDTEAILFEGKLIKEWRPKYNISFRDDKRFPLVRVDLQQPFPRLEITRLRREDGARYFGPFPNETALRSSVKAMIKKYGLRSCRPQHPDEKDFKHCLEHIIQNCSAPCVAKITEEEYRERILEACQLLEGKSHDMVAHITKEMHQAAEKLDFEKAASLRNLLQDLNNISEKTRRFTRKSLPTTIDPVTDIQELTHYLGLPHSATVMECFDISNISSTHIVASMVQFREGRPYRKNYRRYRITSTNGQNDFASMAEVIRRRYSRQLQEGLKAISATRHENQLPLLEQIREHYHLQGKESPLPDLIIVDGGKGQLSAACKELHQLGLQEIPIIGLAKEFEEIYRPGESTPLRLDHNNGALKLLQRIRDEAHRVANGYHQLLLSRRISESLLDDIPGISSQKKRALLGHFGTVSRLRRATATEIALTPGIGKKLSEQIVNYLHQKKRKRYQLRSS